jgi:hypothetical protein
MYTIPFQTIDWSNVEKTVHPGETGSAVWQTLQFGGLRVRLVEYSPHYKADHWCQKGHIIYCLSGAFISEMEDGGEHLLSAGRMYVVSDGLSSHRSTSTHGARILIVDGDFLQGAEKA